VVDHADDIRLNILKGLQGQEKLTRDVLQL